MELNEVRFTDKQIESLVRGNEILIPCDIKDNVDIVIIDGIECKYLGREPRFFIPYFMKHDIYLELKEYKKLKRHVDTHGFVPFELM